MKKVYHFKDKPVGSKFTITHKIKGNNRVFKCEVVLRGNEKYLKFICPVTGNLSYQKL